MSLWKIAWRSIQQRALSSWLTGVSMALGVALVVSVLVIHGVVSRSFSEAAQGYHMIVGAKGGRLQLTLNTVFHLSKPIENIPYSYYKEFTEYEEDGKLVAGKQAGIVEVAVPYCLGDSYKEHRIVATTPDLFDKLSYGSTAEGEPKMYQFAEGRNFEKKNFYEAVIGSVAAHKAGLKLGDTFPITHGLPDDKGAHAHDDLFEVVGILEPTGTPNDRAIFINMEGFYLIGDHFKGDPPPPGEPLPEEQREITAFLLLLKLDVYALSLKNLINEGNVAQAISPVAEVTGLFNTFVRPIQRILLGLAFLIVIEAGIGVMVSIYNSMSDRSREIAVMRALGAGRTTVMLVILFESILIALMGGIGGVLLGHAVIASISPYLVSQTGIAVGFFQFEVTELILVPVLIGVAAVVGFLPALVAYRTDVARALSAAP